MKNFSSLAPTYDAWYSTPFGSLCDKLEKDVVFSLANVKEGELALDVSCGTGNYSLELKRRGARVIGLDISSEMLSIAKKKAEAEGLKIDFIRADAAMPPFKNNSFDLITSILILEFADKPDKMIESWGRLLKSDGRIVIGFLNRYSLWALKRGIRAVFKDTIWRGARFYTKDEVREFLIKGGVEPLKSQEAIYFPPIENRFFLKALIVIEDLGKRFLAGLGAFIAITGRKSL
ncbi:MAG: methyltransferase domain-containing protein [Nitrospirae bacterium]|nr:methyltransferase domain-containing protein [Nitrospirota bacterium]